MAKLSDRGEKILQQLEESTLRINQLLSADNQKKLMTAIGNVGQAADSIGRFSSDSDKVLPQLVLNANATLATMKDTSVRVGDSADEARASARAFRTVTERMNEKGGTLDQLSAGASTLVVTGQTLNSATLPRVNHAVDDAARSARQLGRTADVLGDNPRSLLFGSAPIPPGPGEAGFSANPGKP
jgi:phospholipid/cholesterol/gamma-HCH transport system substrate-binding protein